MKCAPAGSAGRPADVLPLIGWSGAVNSEATALPIAAFCDECTLDGRVGLNEVSDITAGPVNTPIWGFWWD